MPNTTRKPRDNLESRLSIVEYKVDSYGPLLNRIETKLDASIRQIDTLKYVDQHEFDQYKKDADIKFVTNDANRPQKTLFWALITAILTGVIVMGLNLITRQT